MSFDEQSDPLRDYLEDYDKLKAKLAEKADMETFWKNENQNLKDRLAEVMKVVEKLKRKRRSSLDFWRG